MNLYKLFAENFLANIYDADTSIEIHPEHLRAGGRDEIFQNFIHYRNAAKSMFENIGMIEKDIPISVVDFTAYIEKKEDRDARDSVVIPLRSVLGFLDVGFSYSQNSDLLKNYLADALSRAKCSRRCPLDIYDSRNI